MQRQRKGLEARLAALARQVSELAPRAGFDAEATQRLGHLQTDMRRCRQEVAALYERIVALRRRMLKPDELAGAVEAFDPLWQSLSPTQQAQLIHLLIDRVEYDAAHEEIAVTFHATGIRPLTESYQESTA